MSFASTSHVLQSVALISFCLGGMVNAQDGDGGATSGIQNGYLGGNGNQDDAAQGSSNSYANLSKGAIIAISVVVAATVILGVTSAVLFYLTKKRQWELRKSFRRSVRKVGNAMKAMTPRTPARMAFSPLPGEGGKRGGKPFSRWPSTKPNNGNDGSTKTKFVGIGPGRGRERNQDIDLEKGVSSTTRSVASSQERNERGDLKLQIPPSDRPKPKLKPVMTAAGMPQKQGPPSEEMPMSPAWVGKIFGQR